ncbi:Abi family protein [Microbacterium horticulturae]|uniref:Abi family protein n=1 Tax=Microbacterium horticulturae TaxID=3028316 RepID=A0ABY8BYM3_9MICO|nr:Abi family protein [Microbacterium sp. KACC 23027]WEG09306.1 Abi family protein [Microbacterium sp. KACC 23027]
MTEAKPYKTYVEQLAILKSRGMVVPDEADAIDLLRRVGYYALSGYSYPFRLKDANGARMSTFRAGTSIHQIEELWTFDNRLRVAAFASIQHVETYLRALLAYGMGSVDPLVHTRPELLSIDAGSSYERWKRSLDQKLADSREEYIVHHRERRDGVVPIWVAVGVLDWGGLSHLFGMAPLQVREEIAALFDLSGPELKSWLRALNVVRNVCAHHSRFFNRYYSLTPKLPPFRRNRTLASLASVKSTTYGMLGLLQYLGARTRGVSVTLLPATLRSFPTSSGLTIGAVGMPDDWEASHLWNLKRSDQRKAD